MTDHKVSTVTNQTGGAGKTMPAAASASGLLDRMLGENKASDKKALTPYAHLSCKGRKCYPIYVSGKVKSDEITNLRRAKANTDPPHYDMIDVQNDEKCRCVSLWVMCRTFIWQKVPALAVRQCKVPVAHIGAAMARKGSKKDKGKADKA